MASSNRREDTLLATPRLEVAGGMRDHRISLERGVALVRRYQERHPSAIRASMFARTAFEDLLSQPDCAGIRMYYAETAEGSPSLVMVGVDAQGTDLYQGAIVDEHWPCPPVCLGVSPFLSCMGAESIPLAKLETEMGQRTHRISLEKGIDMVRLFQDRHPDAIRASMFARTAFEELLDQPGCAGIRIYYAETQTGSPSLVLVGIDAQGNDLYQGQIMDDHWPCPPFCGGFSRFSCLQEVKVAEKAKE